MTFLNGIFKYNWLIVQNFNCQHIDLHLVHGYECIHVLVDDDARTFAYHEYIVENHRRGALPIDVESGLWAWHDGIVSEDEDVSRLQIGYHSSTLELVELAVLDETVSHSIVNTCSIGFVHSTTSEGASLNETACIWHLINAWSLVLQSVLLDAFNWQRASIQNQNTGLDQDQAYDITRIFVSEILHARVNSLALVVQANNSWCICSPFHVLGSNPSNATEVGLRISFIDLTLILACLVIGPWIIRTLPSLLFAIHASNLLLGLRSLCTSQKHPRIINGNTIASTNINSNAKLQISLQRHLTTFFLGLEHEARHIDVQGLLV